MWTERNRQRWAPEILAAFQLYWSETQTRACRDPRMNFETGTSLVKMALDVYCTTGIQPPAALGGRRGLGIVKSWAESVEQVWKETRWRDPERKGRGAEKDGKQFERLVLCGAQGMRRTTCASTKQTHLRARCWKRVEGPWAQHGKKKLVPQKPDNPTLNQLVQTCLSQRARITTNQQKKEKYRATRSASDGSNAGADNTTLGSPEEAHNMKVEGGEHLRCMVCAQTRSFDKMTIFLTQLCLAADEAHGNGECSN